MVRRFLAVLLTVVAVLAAGWLALRRSDIPYDVLETAYASSESQFLTLEDGLKVHFRDQGPKDAPALVLIHGFSASLHTWEPWVGRLKESYRIISLDLPGHGLTRVLDPRTLDADRFVEVIEETTRRIGVDQFVLVGSSMGGNASWRFALDHPDRLDGLVLVGASGWPGEGEEGSPPLIFQLIRNPITRMIIKDLDLSSAVRDGLEASYSNPSFVDDALVERYVSLARAPGHRDSLLTLVAMSDTRAEASFAVLADISVPTLVLHGEQDNLVPASHGRKFADAISGAELEMYDGVGHLPHEEIADQTVNDLTSFLTRRIYVGDSPEAEPSDTASLPSPADGTSSR